MSSRSLMKKTHRSPLVPQGAPLACLGGLLLYSPLISSIFLPQQVVFNEVYFKSCDYKWARESEQALLLTQSWRNSCAVGLQNPPLEAPRLLPVTSGGKEGKNWRGCASALWLGKKTPAFFRADYSQASCVPESPRDLARNEDFLGPSKDPTSSALQEGRNMTRILWNNSTLTEELQR